MKRKRRDRVDEQLKAYSTSAEAMLSVANRQKRGKDWLAYAAAAGAALTMAPAAEAAIVYSGLQNVMLTVTGTSGYKSSFIDMDLGANGLNKDFQIALGRSDVGNYSITNTASALFSAQTNNRFLYPNGEFFKVKKLAGSDLITAGAPFTVFTGTLRFQSAYRTSFGGLSGTSLYGQWGAPTDTGFAGVKFARGADDFLGWVHVQVKSDEGFPREVTAIDWAFEACAGQSIHAGSTQGGASCERVPEPSPLALLAAGAAGLLAWRRLRQGRGNL